MMVKYSVAMVLLLMAQLLLAADPHEGQPDTILQSPQAALPPAPQANPEVPTSESTSQSGPVDVRQVLSNSLRRLPDPAVIGLSRKLFERAKSRGPVDGDSFGKIVDGLSGLSDVQKLQLKSGFDGFSKKFEKDTLAQLLSSVADIVKERNLNASTPDSVKPTTEATPDAEGKIRMRDRLARIEDRMLLNQMLARNRDDDRRNNSSSSSASPANTSSTPSSSTRQKDSTKSSDSNHTSNRQANDRDRNRRNFGNNSSASGNQSDYDRMQAKYNEPPMAKKPKPTPSSGPTPTPDDSQDFNDPTSGSVPGGKAKTVNLGQMGGTMIPELINANGLSGSYGYSDLSGSSGGAVAGAVAAGKSGGGASGTGVGADDGFMNMTYSDAGQEEGKAPGSISGAYQNGVNYISGSSPDSEGDGTSGDLPEYSYKKSPQVFTSDQTGGVQPIGELPRPGVFRFLPSMKKEACDRLQC